MRDSLDEVIGKLTLKEQIVIKLRYGIGGEGIYSIRKIAKKINLSQSRVHQIELKAIVKLRGRSSRKKLIKFL